MMNQVIAEAIYSGAVFASGLIVGVAGCGFWMLRGRDAKAREVAQALRETSLKWKDENLRYPAEDA